MPARPRMHPVRIRGILLPGISLAKTADPGAWQLIQWLGFPPVLTCSTRMCSWPSARYLGVYSYQNSHALLVLSTMALRRVSELMVMTCQR
ncbi:hypothetical protein HDV62DRAFT_208731 [Trichoderma sp. SZMC 28011]